MSEEIQLLSLRQLENILRELQEQTRLLRSIEAEIKGDESKYARAEGIAFQPISPQ
jgi:hypothetical protein